MIDRTVQYNENVMSLVDDIEKTLWEKESKLNWLLRQCWPADMYL